MAPESPRPQPSFTGPVTTAEARALGLPPWRLRRAGLVPVFRTVWVPAGQERTLEGRAAAALHLLPKGSVLSHLTAGRLRGLPLPEPEEDEPIHVLVAKPARPRIDGVRVHLVFAAPAFELYRQRLPVSPGARIWTDLAGVLEPDDALAVGEAIMYEGLATPEEMDDELRAGCRRPGSLHARLLSRLLEPRSASPAHTRLRLRLIEHGLTGFVVNWPYVDSADRWICQPAVMWPRVRVAIRFGADSRTALLRDLGWIVLDLADEDLQPGRRECTLATVAHALASRGWTAPDPPLWLRALMPPPPPLA